MPCLTTLHHTRRSGGGRFETWDGAQGTGHRAQGTGHKTGTRHTERTDLLDILRLAGQQRAETTMALEQTDRQTD